MCGIVGLCKARPGRIGEELTRSLKSLEYRGYDSVGVSVINEKLFLELRKGKGKVDEVAKRLKFTDLDGIIGIGHTRWATHGAPNDVNAHPHTDCTNTIAVVHNGIIRNYAEIKRELLDKGHIFKSETDTETVAHLIEEYLKESMDFYEAFKKTIKRLEGSYALAVITSHDPSRIFFAKKESPLIIGLGSDGNYIASDIPALLHYTRRVIPLKDGELGWISSHEILVEDIILGKKVDSWNRVIIIEWKPDMAKKGGYPHYMIKEIHEQPLAIKSTYEGLLSDNRTLLAAEYLSQAERIYIAASGTSYHAGLIIKYFMETYGKKPVYAFISSEYMQPLRTVNENDILIAISQSGETIDTLRAVKQFKKRGAKVIAVTNVLGSALDREGDLTVPTRAGPEIGVAATKTFLTQIMAGEMMSVHYANFLGSLNINEASTILKELGQASRIVSESIASTEGWAKKTATLLKTKRHAYFLGRLLGVPLSMEAALKVKEITYIHAEAYPAGESKHGPIALIEEGFPVFFLATSDSVSELQSNINEMNARGALTFTLTTRNDSGLGVSKELILLPETSINLEPFALTPPMQLLAYYTAVELKRDPDKPRNLAKTVTVE